MESVAQWSLSELVIYGGIAAALMELITILGRFGLGLQSTRDTAWLARLTRGVRIHHGYLGAACLPLGLIEQTALCHGILVLGIGMLVSDLIHHFCVLWPLTGSHEFDFRYPCHRRDLRLRRLAALEPDEDPTNDPKTEAGRSTHDTRLRLR